MFNHHLETAKSPKFKLRRYKSQNQVISFGKPVQIIPIIPEKKAKHFQGPRSRSKSKLIENKLFAGAKKLDDKVTLLTSSTMSQDSIKFSNILSGVTKSCSKKSLECSKKILIKNVGSEVIIPPIKVIDHQLSILIKEYTIKKKDSSQPFEDDASSITFKESISLESNSDIQELDESAENDVTQLKRTK